MADGLTVRQTQILKALIDDYLETAQPVGSSSLEKKHDLNVSSATIRNEMFRLTKLGYLRQPYTSAGRVPTPLAMKFYINQLMEEKELSLVDEVKAKEEVWDSRNNFGKLIEESIKALADKTSALAIAATDDGETWSSGYSHVFESPEFANLEVCRRIFSLLDEHARLHDLFFQHLTGSFPIEVLFGEELGWSHFEPVGIVAARFETGGKDGAIGVIGPFGLNYPYVIPIVRYFSKLIMEVAGRK